MNDKQLNKYKQNTNTLNRNKHLTIKLTPRKNQMINLEIFSVYDSKTELFIQPFHAPTVASGLRMFTTAVNDQAGQFFQHAADYTLFHLGTFDQASGLITPLDALGNLGLASSLITSQIQGE